MKPRPAHFALALVAALALPIPAPAAVVGEIVSVGHNVRSVGSGGRRVVRLGAWTPVVVELSLEGQTRFDGKLRLGQRDRDGDVCYDEREVHLLGDSGSPQRYTLYTLPQPGPNGVLDVAVELLDLEEERQVQMRSGGQLVRVLKPGESLEVISDDEYVILEISEGQMGRVAALLDPEHKPRPARMLNIAHAAPASIPDRWQGLEAVDCIIWEDADPDALSEAQRRALADWTRQGGLLLVAAARRAAALAKSDVFGPLLPVEVGELVTFREAPEFRSRLLDLKPDDESDPGYSRPVTAVRCTLRSAPGIRRVFPPAGQTETEQDLEIMVARRRFERGRVVFVCAPLRDLLDPQGNPALFFQRVLEIRSEQGGDDRFNREERMDHLIEAQVGYQALGGVYMLLAVAFVSGYIALATFGSWSFLRSRGWEKHNWSVFAVVAGAAAVVSTIAVQTLLGVGTDLHQLSVVDATAGRPSATATAWFGVKTGTHATLDFWVPENYAQRDEPAPTDCFLRPMPSSRMPGEAENTYADPGSYGLRPVTAELSRVPVRATLKQLEGRWRGELRGSVQASIRVVTRKVPTGEKDEDGAPKRFDEPVIDEGSTLTNLLGVNLVDAYLFQAKFDTYDGRLFAARSPRAKDDIVVHRLGPIRDQETKNLAASLYLDPNTGAPRDRDGRNGWYKSLWQWQNGWGAFASRNVTGPSDAVRAEGATGFMNALLLATALSEYDQGQSTIKDAFGGSIVSFTRDRCRGLDLSDLITRDTLLFVGFAPAAGPVSLCARSRPGAEYRRIEPSEAWTMYRVLIPVEGAK